MNSYPAYTTKSKVCSDVETEEFQSKQIASWAGTKTGELARRLMFCRWKLEEKNSNHRMDSENCETWGRREQNEKDSHKKVHQRIVSIAFYCSLKTQDLTQY
jgi:hypothetical protein